MAYEVKETSTKLGKGGPYGTSFPTVKGGLNLVSKFAAGSQINGRLQKQVEKRLGGGGGSKRFAKTPANRTLL
jgi:hypothetical protein